MVRLNRISVVIGMLAIGCGPSSSEHGDDTAMDSGTRVAADSGRDEPYLQGRGSVKGRVWAPGNAPGMVPPGHEIPVFEAAVYLMSERLPAIMQRVHCETCAQLPGRGIRTDHKGFFEIRNAEPGIYWLVVQKGQFRLEQQVEVIADTVTEVAAARTTLPSIHEPQNGRWMPRIAVATGHFDRIEDIIGKLGIGEVDASGTFIPASAAGSRMDIYANRGALDSVAIGQLSELFSMTTMRMMDYHIIFIPCSYQTFTLGLGLSGAPTEVLEAIRAYVAAGGKLYVTDWSGEWSDNVFPAQVRFDAEYDTPASAWNGTSWNASQFAGVDSQVSYESLHANAVDSDLHAWLDGQRGPIVLPGAGGYGIADYDASNFVIEGSWDRIEELVTVEIGADNQGVPVFDRPSSYIVGDIEGVPNSCIDAGACNPLTTTFEPTGCGRVLYSTYHTANDKHVGLLPQERVLVYLILEIGECKSGPIIQ